MQIEHLGCCTFQKVCGNKQVPAAMLCFYIKILRLSHKHRCEKEERERGEGGNKT